MSGKSERIDVYPYQRTVRGGDSKKRKKKKGRGWPWSPPGLALTRQAFLLCLAGFFLGRALLLGEMVPGAAAFVAAA
ncbi:MAG TPA: hypothetical protein GXX25_11120, partial [Desulfotomaculum sp.]|nr:hypothetical protein [Desulfotomaculum sp.]